MANHKSAAKRARQDLKKQARNLSTKRAVRTAEKKLRVAIGEKNAESAQTLLKVYVSKLGKAAQKGIYHARTAARKVSRLSSDVHQISQ